MADVVKTKGIKLAFSVFITLELYLVFFSVSFFLYSLSRESEMLDGAFGWVIRTSMKVRSFLPCNPVATMSSLAPSDVMVPRG